MWPGCEVACRGMVPKQLSTLKGKPVSDKETYEMDVDGDGRPDTVQVTRESDGSATYLIDTTGDGKANIHAIDRDDDGVIDEVRIDNDGDGVADARASDTSGEGKLTL